MRVELVDDIYLIETAMKSVKLKITRNLKTEQNEGGLLQRDISEYMGCMHLDVEKFKAMLNQEVEACHAELEATRIESQKIAENTARFLEEQQKMLENFVQQ